MIKLCVLPLVLPLVLPAKISDDICNVIQREDPTQSCLKELY